MKQRLLAIALTATILTGCMFHTTQEQIQEKPLKIAPLLNNEKLTITTNGMETTLQDHTSGTETTYRKILKLNRHSDNEPAEQYTARESYQSEAVTVYIRGGILVILTEEKTFVI